MQMLLSCSISTLWSCVTRGREGSAIILLEQEKLIIPALCTLSSSSQEGIHTSLCLRPWELSLTVPVRNSFHSFVWTAHGSLAVITAQRTVDRNGFLGLNANLLHCLLILSWYFGQASRVRGFVSNSEMFLLSGGTRWSSRPLPTPKIL